MVFKGELDFDPRPPEDFDPERPYADPVAFVEMREWIVRQKWIEVERAKIIREQLRKCYFHEGVNHTKKCRKWVERYMTAIQTAGWCHPRWKKNVEDFRPKKRPENKTPA